MLANALGDDARAGSVARDRLSEDRRLSAPHLVDPEFMSFLRHWVAGGLLDRRRALAALQDLGALPLARYPHTPLLERIWELRDNVTTYDACYVALAEALGCPLVTTDARLSRAPSLRCTVEVLEEPG